MKHTRLALLVASTFLSVPALAASVTMLQFGSFETRDEAEKRIAAVKSKYAAQLAGLEAVVREVKLPPDNLTVYRTQAGPVADRPTAQTICTKLAAGGDECYIVQTAMVAPATTAASVTASSPVSAIPTTAEPVVNALDQAKKDAMAEASAPAPDLTSKLTVLQDMPERDAKSKEALESVRAVTASESSSESTTKPVESAAVEQSYTITPPSAEMQAAMDKAVVEQSQQAAKVDSAVVDAEKKRPRRSFWSRLNPFSDDDEPEIKPQVKLEVKSDAAPVDPVKVVAVAESSKPEGSIPASSPAAMAGSKEELTAKPEAVAPVITEAEPMQLPPPPAPLKSQNSVAMPPAEQAPAPLVTGTISPSTPIEQHALPPIGGNVKVEEATRVPVTSTPMTAAPVMAIPSPSQVQPPSTTDGQKTLWAQIGPFVDGPTATNFWATYRMSHPDFPVVRVRVTTPYQVQLHGQNQTWLRVGPMTRVSSVDNLCASLGAMANLQCGRVMDLGVAAAPDKAPGYLPGSRYQR